MESRLIFLRYSVSLYEVGTHMVHGEVNRYPQEERRLIYRKIRISHKEKLQLSEKNAARQTAPKPYVYCVPRKATQKKNCNRTEIEHTWTGVSTPRRTGKPCLRNSAKQRS
jgi:hypothetical protein